MNFFYVKTSLCVCVYTGVRFNDHVDDHDGDMGHVVDAVSCGNEDLVGQDNFFSNRKNLLLTRRYTTRHNNPVVTLCLNFPTTTTNQNYSDRHFFLTRMLHDDDHLTTLSSQAAAHRILVQFVIFYPTL